MERSDDRTNIWIRHSILAAAASLSLPSSRTREDDADSSTSTSCYGNAKSHPQSSLTPKSKYSSQTKSLSVFTDAPSTSTNTNTDGVQSDTQSAKWGWVKASLLHNGSSLGSPSKRIALGLDDHETDHKSSPSQKETDNSSGQQPKTPLAWQARLKSRSDAHNTAPHSKNSDDNESVSPSMSRKKSTLPYGTLSIEVTDLESQYHGQVMTIPPHLILSNGHDSTNHITKGMKKNSNIADVDEAIFGDCIVMANPWSNFTTLPRTFSDLIAAEQSESSSSNSSGGPKWVSPRGGGGQFSFPSPNRSGGYKQSRHKKKSQPFSLSQSSLQKQHDGKENEDSEDQIDDGMLREPPSDLTNLTHLHEPAVVFSLRHRYAKDEIYTSTGPILLALNPFKDIASIYGEDLMKLYRQRGEGILNGINVVRNNNVRISNGGNGDSSSSIDVGAKLKPHVYAVADNSFRSMMRALEDARGGDLGDSELKVDQSILVSGESGSGKTVTTKIIMKYLAALSKRSVGATGGSSSMIKPVSTVKQGWGRMATNYTGKVGNGVMDTVPIVSSTKTKSRNIEQQVLESNPILESFGNARTIRNDNSSRFGKYIEIKFTSTGKLSGASVDSYLLEKVRLINQADGERNYHVFYELLAGASKVERKRLLIGNGTPQDFIMTNSESETYHRRDGVRDDATFSKLRKAMVTMGFDSEEQLDIFEIVSSLLHLSNLTFWEDASEECTLDNTNPSLGAALELLGVGRDALDSALCCVNIEAGGERLVKKLDLGKTMKALEALIKATYGSLFAYLVQRINNCINGERKKIIHNHPGFIAAAETFDSDDANREQVNEEPNIAAFIGVLDIFGFESFGTNSFEQLCINYCNESLQQQFNKFVFKLEQAEYEREEISWNFIAFPDNQNVLDFIDKKRTGILSILDEQSFLGQCTDQSFVQTLYQKCGISGGKKQDSPFTANTRQIAQGKFCIHHYAGPVEYETFGFLEKNKDELPKETIELLLSSENHFLQHLATIMDASSLKEETQLSSQGARSIHLFKQNSLKRVSVGGQFSSQLQLLRKRIDATAPHYIRCLKPNDKLQPDNFDSAVIADQLKCAGILEAVRVSRVGYPQRYPHKRFVHRYQVLAMKELHMRRQDASNGFKTPSGFGGFNGGYIPTNKRSISSSTFNNNKKNEMKLSAEQECKILVTALARKLLAAKSDSSKSEESEEENVAPQKSLPSSPWEKSLKRTPRYTDNKSPPRFQSQGRSKKLQETNLIEIGIQMGKTKVFLRQHAFDSLERMRGRMTSVAATMITSLVRMHLARKKFIVIRNEHRARLVRRNQMIQEAGIPQHDSFGFDISNEFSIGYSNEYSDFPEPEESPIRNRFQDMEVSLSPQYEPVVKDFKWIWVENRWVKNCDGET